MLNTEEKQSESMPTEEDFDLLKKAIYVLYNEGYEEEGRAVAEAMDKLKYLTRKVEEDESWEGVDDAGLRDLD